MKTNKILIILGLFLLPVLLNAQATKEKTNKVITQISDGSITFTIPANLDSIKIADIEKIINDKLTEQTQEQIITVKANADVNDVIYNDKYMYTLSVRDAYDDDYGIYYYSEWKITKRLISTGKVIAETSYNEGNGRFSTFKELKAQKDFAPVKRCKLAQEVFQIMAQQ